jgi:ERCC4-type nuclease
MYIKLDYRESELVKKCKTLLEFIPNAEDIHLVEENLPIGDIIFNDGEKDLLVIERKSLSDLASSIVDGRYEEQSYRLNGSDTHNHNIFYLVEGDLTKFNGFKEKMDKLTLYSTLFSLTYYKGFSVIRSVSIDESATIICNIATKLIREQSKKREPFYKNMLNNSESAAAPTSEKEYCSVVKKVKKENVTVENIGEIMLSQIPGVSSTTAITILGKFGSLPGLIKAIGENENCLNDICTTDAKGKSRKISKTCIANIVNFLKK